MAQPYIGEIRMFAGNFAPVGWAFCDGQLMPISENDALFTLIGTMYGGDGQETFALPNLQSRIPVHFGQGPGISQNYIQAEMVGVETVTLSTQQIPVHNHAVLATESLGNTPNPQGNVPARSTTITGYINDTPTVTLAPMTSTISGGSQPHDNMMPYLCINFIISLFGLFPQQT